MNKFIRHGHKMGLLMSLALVIAVFALLAMPQPATAAGTTELTVTKYVYDSSGVISQMTVNYEFLYDNFEVMGDGTTRYYHQGPVFKDDPDPDTQEQLRWNPEEDTNWDTKDMGAVMGTNVRDICDLVDGMQEGDRFEIIARDGFKKEFAYKNVYEYDPDREGPMVLCWYKDEMYPDSGYEDGMRLVWFAAPTYKEGPTSIEGLPSGNYHVFGNWDWHEAADPEYWYYYQGQYPTTTGLSVQNVSRINIYTSDYDELAIPPTLTADNEGNKVGQSVDIIFADDAAWRNAIIGITVNGKALTSKQFSVTEGNIKLSADVFSAVGEYNIVVQAIGYSNATVKQKMEAPAPEIPLTIVVKENGVETQSVEYNLGEWEELERQHYSIRDSMPAYRLGAAEGVYLEDILNAAEINIESINGFKFVSTDKESFPLSKSELFDVQRYYYPNIFLENKEEGAQVVKPMLALKSYVGSRNDSTLPSWDSIDDLNTIRLFVGQKNVEDINYGLYAKWICEIEVELAEPSQPVAVTGVSITESNQELEVGKTVQLSAVVEPEDATNKNVTWSSDDETVATVSATGLVTTVAKGTATITVTTEDGNKTAAITVTRV
ncbi:MAG: hemoblobin-interacting domain-containing protein [Syntrophomonadales bacterium]